MRVYLMLEGSAASVAAFLATVPADLVASSSNVNIAAADESDDDGPASINAPAVDSTGLPWDGRIHASSKSLNEDRTWRKKRKVDPGLVAQVEAELRASAPPAPVPAPVMMPTMPMAAPAMPTALMGEPTPAPMPMAAPAMPAPAVMPTPAPMPIPGPLAAATTAIEAAAAQQAVVAPAPAPAPVEQPATMDFAGFMAHLTGRMQSGAITPDDLAATVGQLNAAYAPHGHAPITAITDIAADPGKLSYTIQLLQAAGKW